MNNNNNNNKVNIIQIPLSQQLMVEKVRSLLLETPTKITIEEQKQHYKLLFDTVNELIRIDPLNNHYKELKAVSLFSFVDHCNISDQVALTKLEEAIKLGPNIKFIKERLIKVYQSLNKSIPNNLLNDNGNNQNNNNNNETNQLKLESIKLFSLAMENEYKGDLVTSFHLSIAAHEKDKENREVNLHLGRLYGKQGKFPQANKHVDMAIKGKPIMWEAHMEKALLEQKEGNSKAAITRLGLLIKSTDTSNDLKKRALLLKIFYLNSIKSQNINEIYDESLLYYKLLNIKPYQFNEDQIKSFRKQSPIKIGYMSSHFKEHPIAYFIDGILKYHQKDTFEVHVFQIGTVQEDDYTKRMKSYIKPDNWHVLNGQCRVLADMIRSHRVAILTCLDVHTERDGEIAAWRPAPIIVNYLGYPNTSGIAPIQYRITDELADPLDTKQKFSEKLVRMPQCFLNFNPSHLESIPVSSAPLEKNGFITFGCYNTLSKVQDCTWQCWKLILDQIPTARIILKAPLFIVDTAIQTYRERLIKLGVAVDRVILKPYSMDTTKHYSTYDEMDISLDPFPYNGTTTSMDSLWMGVPFVTCAGPTHVHSVGRSILSNVGLGHLVANNIDQYVDITVKLAQDHEEIKKIRSNLRDMLKKSIISNPKDFTIQLEDKFIYMFNNSL